MIEKIFPLQGIATESLDTPRRLESRENIVPFEQGSALYRVVRSTRISNAYKRFRQLLLEPQRSPRRSKRPCAEHITLIAANTNTNGVVRRWKIAVAFVKLA